MKYNGIWGDLLYRLNKEPRGIPVENRHSTTVPDRRVHTNDAVEVQPEYVDSILDLNLLDDAQIQVVLVHPPQQRLN